AAALSRGDRTRPPRNAFAERHPRRLRGNLGAARRLQRRPYLVCPAVSGLRWNMSRTVLITGASRGIGAATVRLLADHGWQVIATTRDPRPRAAGDGDALRWVRLDFNQPESIESTAGEILDEV